MLYADADSQISVAWGITVGLFASFVQSLGLTIQRKSHVLNQQLPECDQRVEHRRPLWLLGFAIFISSNILGSLFQIASLPVVILAPLGAISLLWNAFFARLLLGDVFSLWMITGTVLIAGGAVLVAVFGIVPESTHSLEDLLRLFGRPTFIVYFSLLGAAVLTCLVITHIAEYSLARTTASFPLNPPTSPGPLTLPIPSSFAPPSSTALVASEHTPLLDRKPLPLTRSSTPTPLIDTTKARNQLLLAISYASVSGILSGMCLIFAKSGVELLLLTIGGKNQFWRWEAWLLLLGLLVFALLQLWYLQKSLVFADPTIICPLAFCFYNMSSIVNGLVYYDQFALLSVLQLWLVSLGMVVLLGGVWLVSFHAGSGRVDVGTWQEGDDNIEEEEVQEGDFIPEGYSSPTFSPRCLESALSDSEIPHTTMLSQPLHSITFPGSNNNTERDNEHLAQTRALSTGSLTGRSKRRQYHFSFLHSESSSSALNVPGGGFSIGLSPISPGFAIVPKRRISGLHKVVQRVAMRRTLSESDMDANTEIEGESRHHNNIPDVVPGVVPVPDAHQRKQVKAKARWRWLRSVYTERDA
ncbi:hypothetical protein EW145_g868 [Phellinidium pouzarii]|uniref:Uncharacterized protein n=1 Tax=Phellinidium pouzarii TaxID=167371 RepID=A0A4S4LII2_9AGAM|nr:hypothetical protein EW145_g868 [Phellinidium pouzarii]